MNSFGDIKNWGIEMLLKEKAGIVTGASHGMVEPLR